MQLGDAGRQDFRNRAVGTGRLQREAGQRYRVVLHADPAGDHAAGQLGGTAAHVRTLQDQRQGRTGAHQLVVAPDRDLQVGLAGQVQGAVVRRTDERPEAPGLGVHVDAVAEVEARRRIPRRHSVPPVPGRHAVVDVASRGTAFGRGPVERVHLRVVARPDDARRCAAAPPRVAVERDRADVEAVGVVASRIRRRDVLHVGAQHLDVHLRDTGRQHFRNRAVGAGGLQREAVRAAPCRSAPRWP